MDINLKEKDEVIIKNFKRMTSRSDISDILEIDDKNLVYCLYRKKVESQYEVFEILKKNGNKRKISASTGSLKIIQKKLSYILNLIYNPRECVQGYVPLRSVITNAKKHLNSKFIINIDIKDFFSSINFGRVRGLFLNYPFSFTKEVATVLAQICCFDNELPQGSPTSPIISNLICSRFDTQMIKFAKRNRMFFTRYVDDIALSTNISITDKILTFENGDHSKTKLSAELIKILHSNGFKLNRKKLRFSTKKHHQEVTGIVVNEKLNVHRSYMKEIRAMLHSWEKNGLDKAQNDYYNSYCRKYIANKKDSKPDFPRVVKGKLTYLKMVRGYQDKIYRKYHNQYVKLTKKGIILPINFKDILNETIYVVEVSDQAEQGTVFYVENYGWVTNYHVIRNNNNDLKVYTSDRTKFYDATVKKEYRQCDLAILNIPELEPQYQLKANTDYSFSNDKHVTVCGYPEHHIFDSLYINSGKIVSSRYKNSILYYVFEKPIIKGNSGGPVLNDRDEVVGIASTGSTFHEADKTMFFGIIPIKNLENNK